MQETEKLQADPAEWGRLSPQQQQEKLSELRRQEAVLRELCKRGAARIRRIRAPSSPARRPPLACSA